jgi:hypothetical protein
MRSLTDIVAVARLLHKLSRSDEAREVWVSLIESNTECYDHYKGYLSTQFIDLGMFAPENMFTYSNYPQ